MDQGAAPMKIIFHEDYKKVYSHDPAASEGRLDTALTELKPLYPFVTPEPASLDDIALVHTPGHIASTKRDPAEYKAALLAAGGAILSAELGAGGEPAFGLVRPPGHHASPDSCWGFCFFNNMGIAIKKIHRTKGIKKVFILDFDLHTGDGNINSLATDKNVEIFNPPFPGGREAYMEGVAAKIESLKGTKLDLVACSAGFDTYEHDWGGLVKTEDFKELGRLLKELSQNACENKRFAILEGGYNHSELGKNIHAFLSGFD